MDSAHPIAPAVRTDVQALLSAIDAEHGVRVLYGCESGSRGWADRDFLQAIRA